MPAPALPTDTCAKVVLLSDAWLPSDAYRHCAFAITRTTPFRFQKADTRKTRQYYNLQRDPAVTGQEVLGRSDRYTLLQRGSVLYAKDGNLTTLAGLLQAQKAFRDIGYNYFVEIPADSPN